MPEKPLGVIRHLEAFDRFMILSSVESDGESLSVFGIDGKVEKIPFPEGDHIVHWVNNKNYYADRFRFGLSSMSSPLELYEYEVDTGQLNKVAEQSIENYRSNDYRSEQFRLVSNDGLLVPMNVIVNKKLKKEGPQPLVLVPYRSDQELIENSFEIKIYTGRI